MTTAIHNQPKPSLEALCVSIREKDSPKAVERMIDARPGFSSFNGPFRLAVQCDRPQVAQLLVKRARISVEKQDAQGRKALHYAQSAETAQLAMDGKPNETDSHGDAPLHLAASRGAVGAAKVLIDYRADVNLPNPKNSLPPLHVATDPRMIQLLLKRKADPAATDAEGQTALHRHAERGEAVAAAALLLSPSSSVSSESRDLACIKSFNWLEAIAATSGGFL